MDTLMMIMFYDEFVLGLWTLSEDGRGRHFLVEILLKKLAFLARGQAPSEEVDPPFSGGRGRLMVVDGLFVLTQYSGTLGWLFGVCFLSGFCCRFCTYSIILAGLGIGYMVKSIRDILCFSVKMLYCFFVNPPVLVERITAAFQNELRHVTTDSPVDGFNCISFSIGLRKSTSKTSNK
ncbi:hypothetical protein BT63DRAFT_19490 [Microthyrium microscopicum]|uniref:Uncharacterized protein n=1 Tax=Microthyrium microscopicum TaxID=703497 RepID=A0A6A6UTF6_9PEZI|nr:hypothetical protein BT63DRAFT_19490 [Microthyrium microscopicum]